MKRREFLGLAAGAALMPSAQAGVALKDLVEVKLLAGGGKVYAFTNRSASQMHSAVFLSPEGRVLVVDGGFYRDGPFLNAFLKSLGGKVDYWFITHAHDDHYGALVEMFHAAGGAGIEIGELLFDFPDRAWLERGEPSSKPHLKRFYDEFLAGTGRALARGACTPGRVVKFGSWSFEILNAPRREQGNTINNSSVMLSVQAGGTSWLVTGDLGVEAGRHFAQTLGPRLRHDVVFLAHHGQNGVEKAFYAAVAPKIAIWPTPDWLWDNNLGGRGVGSGPWRTNYVKCWMQELGVKSQFLLTRDHVFL